jgi:hypothetical protein
VTQKYRAEFIHTFDQLIATFDDVFDSYAVHSQKLRAHFEVRKKRFPILHRNGNAYLVSPASERMEKVEPQRLPRFGFYKV